jgi:hypothetical protein
MGPPRHVSTPSRAIPDLDILHAAARLRVSALLARLRAGHSASDPPLGGLRQGAVCGVGLLRLLPAGQVLLPRTSACRPA